MADAIDRLAVRAFDVDRGPRIFRLLDAIEEDARPEIELVVARHSQVERHDIGELDRVSALIETGEQGGGDHVAVEQVEGVRIGGLLGLGDGVEPGKPTAHLAALEGVDVADADDGELEVFGEGRGRRSGARRNAEQGGYRKPRNDGFH